MLFGLSIRTHFSQFLPHFHHCPGVELAVAEKGFATGNTLFVLYSTSEPEKIR